MAELQKALDHPLWKTHKRNISTYTMDGKSDRWKLVYYPIFSNYNESEIYEEPRALMQNIDKPAFWNKEVPLRYLNKQ